MPPPTKRQKQAKQQYASSSRCFDNGLIEDVFEVFLDPDYVPVSDAESEADSESDFNGALSFSLIDGNIGEVSDNESESDDEAAMEIVVEAEETVDYAEGCARRAAVSAQKFWANIMSSVSNINQCTDIHRKFDQDVFSGDTKPVKLPKRSMPTYSGTARTSTYLRKRKMREGAKNNMTITSFWAPKPPAKDTANDPQNESRSPSEPSPASTSDIDITSESIDEVPMYQSFLMHAPSRQYVPFIENLGDIWMLTGKVLMRVKLNLP